MYVFYIAPMWRLKRLFCCILNELLVFYINLRPEQYKWVLLFFLVNYITAGTLGCSVFQGYVLWLNANGFKE